MLQLFRSHSEHATVFRIELELKNCFYTSFLVEFEIDKKKKKKIGARTLKFHICLKEILYKKN